MPSQVIAVFGASSARQGDGQYEDGVRCGRLLGEAGFAVATGGYGGLMEAVSAGAHAAGADVIGVTAPTVFPDREGGNRYLTRELRAAELTERIHKLTDMAAASISLPGSLGTLTELVMAWNLAFVSRFNGEDTKPVVAVGPIWPALISRLATDLKTDASLVTCVATVDEAVDAVTTRLSRGSRP